MAKGNLALSLTPDEMAKAVANLKIAGLKSVTIKSLSGEATIVYDVPVVGETEIDMQIGAVETP